jgi:putative transcriptional regulator
MRFVETPIFTKVVTGLIGDDEYRSLQIALMLRPEQGPVIKGTGGLRSGRVQMKDSAFQALVGSIRQAGRIRRGTLKPSRTAVFRPSGVKVVRRKLGASQSEFALMIGVSVATLRGSQQGRRKPHGPALALLRVAAKNPGAVAEALNGKRGAA